MWKIWTGLGSWFFAAALQLSGVQNAYIAVGLSILGVIFMLLGFLDWRNEQPADYITLGLAFGEVEPASIVSLAIVNNEWSWTPYHAILYTITIDIKHTARSPNAISKVSLRHTDKSVCGHYRLAEITVLSDKVWVMFGGGVFVPFTNRDEVFDPSQVIELPISRVLIRKKMWIVGKSEGPPGSCEIEVVAQDVTGTEWCSAPFTPGGTTLHADWNEA